MMKRLYLQHIMQNEHVVRLTTLTTHICKLWVVVDDEIEVTCMEACGKAEYRHKWTMTGSKYK